MNLDAQGIILAYDVTSRKSFDDLKIWLRDIRNNADSDAIICLAANKIDLKQKQQVSIENGKLFAKVCFRV